MTSEIKNFALVDTQTNTVCKIVYWDGVSDINIHDLPEQYELILIEDKKCFVWEYEKAANDIIIVEKTNMVWTGMIWDGEIFKVTEESKPKMISTDIKTSGLDVF